MLGWAQWKAGEEKVRGLADIVNETSVVREDRSAFRRAKTPASYRIFKNSRMWTIAG